MWLLLGDVLNSLLALPAAMVSNTVRYLHNNNNNNLTVDVGDDQKKKSCRREREKKTQLDLEDKDLLSKSRSRDEDPAAMSAVQKEHLHECERAADGDARMKQLMKE